MLHTARCTRQVLKEIEKRENHMANSRGNQITIQTEDSDTKRSEEHSRGTTKTS